MTLEEWAAKIAAEANGCCNRSDGYRESIEESALEAIRAAVAEEREACAQEAENWESAAAAVRAIRSRGS